MNLERVARIELAHLPWQGSRLPLHHTRSLTSRHMGPAQLDRHLSSLTAVLVCIPLYAVPGMFHIVLSNFGAECGNRTRLASLEG